jgi:hypothetical protein
VSLRGRRDQPRQSQCKDAKRWTHGPFRTHSCTFPKGTDLIVATATAPPAADRRNSHAILNESLMVKKYRPRWLRHEGAHACDTLLSTIVLR